MDTTDYFSDLRLENKTILFVDVVGSVALLEEDEKHNVSRIRRLMSTFVAETLPSHNGKLIERVGDGILAEFNSPSGAVKCAFDLHKTSVEQTEAAAQLAALRLRIGIHRADVFADENSIFGRGVNIAARLASLAAPGQTIASAAIAESLVPEIDANVEDLGECYLKHIATPIRAFKLDGLSATSSRFFKTIPEGINVSNSSVQNLLPVIAILPFTPYDINVLSSAQNIGDVLTDRVISAISKSSALLVISRLSTGVFKNREVSVNLVKQALAADFLVSGRYSLNNNQITVSVEVCDTSLEQVLWTKTISASAESAAILDSDLVSELVIGIAASIFASEVRVVRETPLPNVASHALLLSAISLTYRHSIADFDRARLALETLHDRVPKHPGPLAWLARWYLFRVSQGWSANRKQDGDIAHSYAKRALEIDPHSSLALTMLGHVQTNHLVDLDAAEATFIEAINCNPNESLAWLQRGNARSFAGEGELALAYSLRANELSPLDPSRHFYLSLLGSTALTAGDYPRAIDSIQKALKLNVMHASSHRVLAIAQSLTGQLDQAKVSVQRLLKIDPTFNVASFKANSPGKSSGLIEKFSAALADAGLPAVHRAN
jgi:adenylate cyclase